MIPSNKTRLTLSPIPNKQFPTKVNPGKCFFFNKIRSDVSDGIMVKKVVTNFCTNDMDSVVSGTCSLAHFRMICNLMSL